jgi:hypothetical protein
VARPVADVLADLRSELRWASALGGTWSADHRRWSFEIPRPGSAAVTRDDRPHGAAVHVASPLGEARADISAVDDGAGGSTVVADIAVTFAIPLGGAWWVELEREVLPRWLTALTAGAPAGTGPTAG